MHSGILHRATTALLALASTPPPQRAAVQLQAASQHATMEMSTVQLHAVEAGSRVPTDLPPLVLLHGLLGSGSNWATWARALAQSCEADGKPRRIVLVDLRNHGTSGHNGDMSFEAMAGDLVHLLDRLQIKRAALFGHSIGGKVAMTTALLHRERVERLCVIDIAPTSYDSNFAQWSTIEAVIAAMRSVNLDVIDSKADAEQQLLRTIDDPMLRAFVLMNLQRNPGPNASFRWRVNLKAIENSLPQLGSWDVACNAEKYSGNTLFVAGGKSRFLTTRHLPAIEEQFSRFSLSTIRTAGHWVQAEEPDALLIIANNFLAVASSP